MDFEKLPQIGDEIGDRRDDVVSIVIKVCGYTGRYPEFFTHVVRYTTPQTASGYMTMAVNVLSCREDS